MVLNSTSSVISGSTVLSVLLSRTPHVGNWDTQRDLDIFTPTGKSKNVITYLETSEGYVVDCVYDVNTFSSAKSSSYLDVNEDNNNFAAGSTQSLDSSDTDHPSSESGTAYTSTNG